MLIPIAKSRLKPTAELKSKRGVFIICRLTFLHQMHELGVTENIVNIALAKAGEAQTSKVVRINLVVGELSGLVPDCIQLYFDSVSKGTITQGALLHFESVPSQLRCRKCSAIFRPKDTPWSCPDCRGQSAEIYKGREIYIENIEVE